MSTTEDIKKQIDLAKSIVILTHENPDGDAIGTSLGLYNTLKNVGKNVDIIIPEYPEIFGFLPNSNEIKKESDVEKYDLAISLDCSDEKRLMGFSKYFDTANMKIVIDHHRSNTMFGDINFVNPDAPACAQLLIVLFHQFGYEITNEIGTCILTGIITDTGGFIYSSVTPETFEFAAYLLAKGINVSNICKKVLQTKTMNQYKMHSLAASRLEFIEEGKIAYTFLTEDEINSLGGLESDTDGIVECGRDIEGVEVSMFIRQKADMCKVSFRSNDYVDVSEICLVFGGGGHKKAAGVKIEGNIETVKEKMIMTLKSYLK